MLTTSGPKCIGLHEKSNSSSSSSSSTKLKHFRVGSEVSNTHMFTQGGAGDLAAVLITPNGSIRPTVMINPLESLLLDLFTCWEAAHPPLPPLFFISVHRHDIRGQDGLESCNLHKVTGELSQDFLSVKTWPTGIVAFSLSFNGHTLNFRYQQCHLLVSR